jgi:phosphate transport system substrate-binding protein
MQWIGRALASQYMLLHRNVAITVQSSNSAAGLAAATGDSRTIGLVARVIKPNELQATRAVVIARDGIAVIVNQKNPINAIQRTQIAQVFSGEILTWPTGPDAGKPIAILSREDGSGTRNAFEAMIMGGQRVTLTALVMPGEGAVVDYVAQHTDAIGYVSMGALTSDVHALAVDEVPLTLSTVESQQYPLVRTLALVVPAQPNPELQQFVDFALSSEGQTIIGQRFGRAPQ